MNFRKQYEELQKQTLSEFATLPQNSKGRAILIEPCDLRTDFQRDRDRIIHSKAFRRLKHKTQVFVTPEGDHYRTRLTHTLEVSQIARTIARCLRLNEDLVEAISLGHDLGHTPFGHAGEHKLNEICPYGFNHAQQSLRVVDVLENGRGLNLTYEVRDGIVNHTSKSKAATPEAQIVQFADRIAYVNHDIDDAIRGGIITADAIPSDCAKVLGTTHSSRIDTMIRAVINGSLNKPEIAMLEPYYSMMLKLRQFMFDHVYIESAAKEEEKKATQIIEALYNHYLTHPQQIKDYEESEDLHRTVCDYIAGMSDSFAIKTYKDLYVPKAWHVM